MSRAPGPVLVVGASGMLGRALVLRAERRGLVVVAPPRSDLDLAAPDAVAAAVERLRPGAVVNAAAWTDVGRAERPEVRDEVFRVNRDGPEALAQACRRLASRLLHVSTDYVFDGEKGRPYVEEDPPRPLQVYGRSKLAGEEAVLAADPEVLVVRTSTLYGPGREAKPHYVDAILAQASTRRVIEVVEKPVASPTYSFDLAEAILGLLGAGASGLIHAVNSGGCSRLELARAAIEEAGLGGEVEVRTRAEREDGVGRPPYSVLSTVRLERTLGRPLRPWREALREYVRSRAGAPRR